MTTIIKSPSSNCTNSPILLEVFLPLCHERLQDIQLLFFSISNSIERNCPKQLTPFFAKLESQMEDPREKAAVQRTRELLSKNEFYSFIECMGQENYYAYHFKDKYLESNFLLADCLIFAFFVTQNMIENLPSFRQPSTYDINSELRFHVKFDLLKTIYSLEDMLSDQLLETISANETVFTSDLVENYSFHICKEARESKTDPNALVSYRELIKTFLPRVREWYDWIIPQLAKVKRLSEIRMDIQVFAYLCPEKVEEIHKSSRYFKDFFNNIQEAVFLFSKNELKTPAYLSRFQQLIKTHPEILSYRQGGVACNKFISDLEKVFRGATYLPLMKAEEFVPSCNRKQRISAAAKPAGSPTLRPNPTEETPVEEPKVEETKEKKVEKAETKQPLMPLQFLQSSFNPPSFVRHNVREAYHQALTYENTGFLLVDDLLSQVQHKQPLSPQRIFPLGINLVIYGTLALEQLLTSFSISNNPSPEEDLLSHNLIQLIKSSGLDLNYSTRRLLQKTNYGEIRTRNIPAAQMFHHGEIQRIFQNAQLLSQSDPHVDPKQYLKDCLEYFFQVREAFFHILTHKAPTEELAGKDQAMAVLDTVLVKPTQNSKSPTFQPYLEKIQALKNEIQLLMNRTEGLSAKENLEVLFFYLIRMQSELLHNNENSTILLSHLTYIILSLNHLIIEKTLFILLEKQGKTVENEHSHDLYDLVQKLQFTNLSEQELEFLRASKFRQAELRYHRRRPGHSIPELMQKAQRLSDQNKRADLLLQERPSQDFKMSVSKKGKSLLENANQIQRFLIRDLECALSLEKKLLTLISK